MKKKTWILVAAVAAGIVLVLLALPLLVNVDAYRPIIQSQLSSSLGREVSIGHLSLSLLAGGISARDITIADDPAFSNTPFLHAQSLDVGVDLLPMIFSRSLKVHSLTLEQPEVTLLHSAAGRWNFSSLGQPGRPGKKGQPPSEASSSSNFSVGKLRVVDGKITVGESGRSARRTYEKVNLEAENISFDSVIPFTLEAVTPGGGKLSLGGKAGPIDRQDTAATPLDATLKVEHMDLGATGFLDPSSGLGGSLDHTGTIKSDGRTLHAEGTASVDKLKVVKSGQPARQPVKLDYATDYSFPRQSGELTRGDLHTGSSTAKLSGSYSTRGDSTVLNMKLRGDSLPVGDVEGVLPAFGVILPSGSRLEGGTASANLALQGPLDRLVTSGPVSVSNTRLAGFNLGSKMSAIAALTGLKTGSDTVIQSMSSNLRVASEGVRADNLNIVIQDLGTVTGAGTIGANNALNFRMLAKLANGGGLVGGMGQILSMGQQQGTIPFLIQGTTSSPIFVPDVAGQLTNTMGAPAQGVGGILGGLLGGGQQQQQQQQKKKPH
ncbi:MAG TPA: AsmA family protein [Terriglobales bacterium]|nr:AsmA family protein [Terriglobales bacterium]